MPGRHVRFSAENAFYSPSPQLSRSTSSATSSSGPFTPPTLPYASLPGPTPYKPHRSYTDVSASTARAHNLVAFADSPLLNFDLTVHPSAITTHFQGVASAGFLEPAVYPPQRTISITTPHLPWTITASNGRFITVSDALNELYRLLRTNKLARRVTEAYTHRYMRFLGHHGYAEEKKQGVKRVDFLMGCTKFQGLSPTGAADVWRVHVS
ncbi:hypothetical protein B0H14DRAFT_2790072 [Mycena olivaceomarginata]|nr:hypothetical protein B0H14DRAFT_2790072 [Mycena olivaceomarginata]